MLDAIKKEIDNKKIAIWLCDKDFIQTPEQWKNKAWLKPTVGIGELKFVIVKRTSVTKLDNARLDVYYGRF